MHLSGLTETPLTPKEVELSFCSLLCTQSMANPLSPTVKCIKWYSAAFPNSSLHRCARLQHPLSPPAWPASMLPGDNRPYGLPYLENTDMRKAGTVDRNLGRVGET